MQTLQIHIYLVHRNGLSMYVSMYVCMYLIYRNGRSIEVHFGSVLFIASPILTRRIEQPQFYSRLCFNMHTVIRITGLPYSLAVSEVREFPPLVL